MGVTLGGSGGNSFYSGHAECAPTPGLIVAHRVYSIDDLLPGNNVGIILHSKSLGFIPNETYYIGYVRHVDSKRRTVELSPFKSKSLRNLLPAFVTVDTKNFSAKGLVWSYEIKGGEGSFNKYTVAE